MSRRIDIDAGEVGPPLDEIIRHIEDGSVHELVIRRDGREVARLSRPGSSTPVSQDRQYAWDHAREHSARRGTSLGGMIGNLLGLAVIAGGLAFFLAPGYAFFALRSAALSGDVPALAELVDYGEVRASLRSQFSTDPRAQEPEPGWLENPIEAIRRRLGQAAEEATGAAPNVDGYLTPPALAAITFGEGRFASERSRAGAPPIEHQAEDKPWPGLIHWGPSRTRFRVRDEGGSDTLLTFTRTGVFAWKLSHIGLPDGSDPEGGAAAEEDVPQAG